MNKLVVAALFGLAAALPNMPVAAQAAGGKPAVAGSTFRDCIGCPQMIVLPAGRFMMGSPETEKDRFKDEGPLHPVEIARPFAVGVTTVTRGEYARFVRETGRADRDSCKIFDPAHETNAQGSKLKIVAGKNWREPNYLQTDRHPVVCISWDDAHAYIDWLNTRASGKGGTYRLLSEAEWEYAARAGTSTPYSWGEEISRDRANYGLDEKRFWPMAAGRDRWGYSSPVKAFPANPFGLYDMAGNVWQMVEDCWHPDYQGAPADGSAWVSPGCTERVVRGGSWYKPPTGERHAKRGKNTAEDMLGLNESGFRVAKTLE